jgi:manganese/iron transport system substrate-binding protein
MSFQTSRRSALGLAMAAMVSAAPIRVVRGQSATPTPPSSSLGWSDSFDTNNGLMNIVTTVAPISSIARNVGGTRINLAGVVPDGTNSHTFEPAPSDAVILSKADVVFVNGLQLEQPTMDLAKANLKQGAEIDTLGDQTISPDQFVYDFSFPKDQGKPNPHLWMNPLFALKYAELIQAKLAERDAANAAYYADNLARYSDLLHRLDEGIMAATATIPKQNRKLLTYHDSYAYFAPRYGLTVIGAAQPSDFSEPSARDVAQLIDQIKAEHVPAVFGSEVFPSTVLEQIAKESGAQYIDQLRDDNPPGKPGDPDHTYVGMMLKNMQLMIPALGGTVDALAGIEPWDTYQP